ncbi:MAG TPA: quinolinate synthase NadA [Candidatus Limnocylindrales bacterium]|nr:quinolinate synthase NadA [Candidatus Limnocylindrales bacterium]
MTPTATKLRFEDRYTLPIVEEIHDSADEIRRKQARIQELKALKNAVVLAHNYQRDEVQDVADFVGDSLKLSQTAASTRADVIVFCGVHFMAETAAILCPERTVLLPDLRAQCSLASSITVEELLSWKKRYPDAVVVSYINTSAAVKAESDYCCTSANATKVVNSIPRDKQVLLLPDKYLADVVARQTGRTNIIAYPGYCHVHKSIDPQQVVEMMDDYPDIELLIHPECGCVSACMVKVLDGTLPKERTLFLSTEGMLRHVQESPAKEFAVGTEIGILHRLRNQNPGKEFYPVNPNAICAFMKAITLDNIIASMESMTPQVTVPADIARRAKRAIDRMLESV